MIFSIFGKTKQFMGELSCYNGKTTECGQKETLHQNSVETLEELHGLFIVKSLFPSPSG